MAKASGKKWDRNTQHQTTLEETGAINNNYKEDLIQPHGECLEQKKNNITSLGLKNINGIKGPL